MRNLVLLIVMLLAGGGGWFAGSWSGAKARDALKRAEQAGEQAKSEHDKAAGALNARIAGLSADFDRKKQQLDADHTRQTDELKGLIASSKSRIDELGKARTGTQAEIQRLKTALAGAATPQERQKIEVELAKVEVVEKVQGVQIVSLQCLDLPVPAEVLASWRGSAP